MTREQALQALKDGQSITALTYSFEEYRWLHCDILPLGNSKFHVKCEDGIYWDIDESELMDAKQFKSFH